MFDHIVGEHILETQSAALLYICLWRDAADVVACRYRTALTEDPDEWVTSNLREIKVHIRAHVDELFDGVDVGKDENDRCGLSLE